MDLSAIVASAMNAVPTGLKGSVTFTHVSGRVFVRAIDASTSGTTTVTTVANAVVTTPRPDEALDGVEVDRQRRITVAASDLPFVLEVNDTTAFGGHTWTVMRKLPTGPDGSTDALYDVVVSR